MKQKTTKRVLSANGTGGAQRMNTNHEPATAALNRWKFKDWPVLAAVLLSFAAGSLLTARLMRPSAVSAGSNRVFELRVYHTLPGKVSALESIFGDLSPLMVKHGINVVGYWAPYDDPAWANTFVYLVAHSSQEQAEKNWEALHADPDFPQYRTQAAPLIEKGDEGYKVDEVFMRPADYSAMK
jgi:NIPSNAP protein